MYMYYVKHTQLFPNLGRNHPPLYVHVHTYTCTCVHVSIVIVHNNNMHAYSAMIQMLSAGGLYTYGVQCTC